MLAAAAIARRGEKRGSRPRSERKAPPGEPRAGSKTREPTIAPVRGSPDHTSGHYSDSGIGSSESISNGGPFAPTGGTGSGAGSSRGSIDGHATPKADTWRMPYIPDQGSDGADTGQLWHLSSGVADRWISGVAKAAPSGRRDRAHESSSSYAYTSRLLDVPDRVGGASGRVSSGSAGSGLPALYVIGDTGKPIEDTLTKESLAFAKKSIADNRESAEFGTNGCTSRDVIEFIKKNAHFRIVVFVDHGITHSVLVSSEFRDLSMQKKLIVFSVARKQDYDEDKNMQTYTAYYNSSIAAVDPSGSSRDHLVLVGHVPRLEPNDSSPDVYGLAFVWGEREYFRAVPLHHMARVVTDASSAPHAFHIRPYFIGGIVTDAKTIASLKSELENALKKNKNTRRQTILVMDATDASDEQQKLLNSAVRELITDLSATENGSALVLGVTVPFGDYSEKNKGLLSSLSGLVSGNPRAGILMNLKGGTADRAGSDSGGDSGNRDPRVPPSNVDAYVIVRSASQVCTSMVYSYATTMDLLKAEQRKNVTVAEWDPMNQGSYTIPIRLVFCVDGDRDIMAVYRKLVDLGTEGLNERNIKMIQYLYTPQNVKAKYMIPPDLFDDTHSEKVVESHTTLGDIYISTLVTRTGPEYSLGLSGTKNTGFDDHIRAHLALETFKSHLDSRGGVKGRLVVYQYGLYDTHVSTRNNIGALVIDLTEKRLMDKKSGGVVAAKYDEEVELVKKMARSVADGVMLVDSHASGLVSVEINGNNIHLNTLLPVSTVLRDDKVQRGIAAGSYTGQRALLDHVAGVLDPPDRRVLNEPGSLYAREVAADAIVYDAEEDLALVRGLANLMGVPSIGKPASMKPEVCIELFNKELERHLEELYERTGRSTTELDKRVAAFLKAQSHKSTERVREAAGVYCNNGAYITEEAVRDAAFKYHNDRLVRVVNLVRRVKKKLEYIRYNTALHSLVEGNEDTGLRPYLITELHENRASRTADDRKYALLGDPEGKAREKFEELKIAALRKLNEDIESVTGMVWQAALDKAAKPNQGGDSAENNENNEKKKRQMKIKIGVRGLIDTELNAGRINADTAETISSLLDNINITTKKDDKQETNKQPRDMDVVYKRVYENLKQKADIRIAAAHDKAKEDELSEKLRIESLENEAKRQAEAAAMSAKLMLDGAVKIQSVFRGFGGRKSVRKQREEAQRRNDEAPRVEEPEKQKSAVFLQTLDPTVYVVVSATVKDDDVTNAIQARKDIFAGYKPVIHRDYAPIEHINNPNAIVVIATREAARDIASAERYLPVMCKDIYIKDQTIQFANRLDRAGYKKQANKTLLEVTGGKESYTKFAFNNVPVSWYSTVAPFSAVNIYKLVKDNPDCELMGGNKPYIQGILKSIAYENRDISIPGNLKETDDPDLRALGYVLVSCVNTDSLEKVSKRINERKPRNVLILGTVDFMNKEHPNVSGYLTNYTVSEVRSIDKEINEKAPANLRPKLGACVLATLSANAGPGVANVVNVASFGRPGIMMRFV